MTGASLLYDYDVSISGHVIKVNISIKYESQVTASVVTPRKRFDMS